MKIIALKNFRWSIYDKLHYEENNEYEVDDKKALEMIKHGYAQEKTTRKYTKKETKVIAADENKQVDIDE